MSSAEVIRVPNPVRRTAVLWWVLAPVVSSGVFVPFVLDAFGIATGDWVFALMFFCFVFGITAIVVAFIYTRRARLLDRMLGRDGLLAHWSFTPEEWSKYAEEEYRRDRREKKNLVIMTVAVSAVVWVVLSIVHPDGWFIFLATVVAVMVLMGLMAWLAVWLRHRRNLRNLGEVYFGRDAVYLNKELHVWNGFGARLEGADYLTDGGGGVIEIVYSVPTRSGRVHSTVRVPVPAGKEPVARDIVARIRGDDQAVTQSAY